MKDVRNYLDRVMKGLKDGREERKGGKNIRVYFLLDNLNNFFKYDSICKKQRLISTQR